MIYSDDCSEPLKAESVLNTTSVTESVGERQVHILWLLFTVIFLKTIGFLRSDNRVLAISTNGKL